MKRNLIRLKPLEETDLNSEYLRWLNDSEINSFLEVRFNPPKNISDLKKYLDEFDNYSKYLFGIFDLKKDKHIGNITLDINVNHATGYFGYVLGDKSFWGTSAISDAKFLLLDFAFFKKKLRRIWGSAYDSNHASIFNFKRFGFHKEAILRDAFYDQDEIVDGISFGMKKEEWEIHRKKFI
jgi:RimJ/RimL family protein N-acetyltransferase